MVGTNAFRSYELELGVRFNPSDAVGTMDLDIAGFERFSIAVDDVAIPDIPTALTSLGYEPVPSLDAALLYRDGILVKIPRPERYAIHKLIVASRRDKRDILKSRKDLQQAGILMEILYETRPGDLSAAYQEALKEGSAWISHLENSFEKAPQLKRLVA